MVFLHFSFQPAVFSLFKGVSSQWTHYTGPSFLRDFLTCVCVNKGCPFFFSPFSSCGPRGRITEDRWSKVVEVWLSHLWVNFRRISYSKSSFPVVTLLLASSRPLDMLVISWECHQNAACSLHHHVPSATVAAPDICPQAHLLPSEISLKPVFMVDLPHVQASVQHWDVYRNRHLHS